jgi:8-oxo-dGTP pyrophosphatase MutT (NUDIX family)
VTLDDRLARALADSHDADTALLTGDHHDGDMDIAVAARAAVLIAVTDRAEPGVLLTRRTETMRNHAGQVAFPGGRIDPEDTDATAAALREAEEEIALPRAAVRVIGTVDRYRTVTGFDVTPVIGVVPPDLVLVPAAAEVAQVFEVPLGFVLDGANHLEATIDWHGRTRHYYEILWDGHRIWGATAAMIVNLSRRLRWTA